MTNTRRRGVGVIRCRLSRERAHGMLSLHDAVPSSQLLWRSLALHTCSVAPARLRPSSHLTPAPRLLRPSLAHPLHTRRVLPAECRETAWALVAGGQQGRCRGVGWGRWDGLIGYGIPTAGRLCAAPISGCGSLAGTSWPCSLNAQGLKGMQQ